MREHQKIDWGNVSFLLIVHALAIGGTIWYFLNQSLTWAASGLFLFWLLACGFSITAGYHRLFAHGSYQANPAIKFFFLFFGAAAFENSALKWATDHRRHHKDVDTEDDPYNIKQGFWWAHIGWVLTLDTRPEKPQAVGDLKADPLVNFQHRFYVPLAFLAGFGCPAAVGYLLGDVWGGLILAGLLRMIVLYHATFCVNSLAHTIGRQPFSDKDSSRDSMITAFVTLGEGYHNFHHTFPYDYRNGVRKFHFDPTKWLIRTLRWTGLARDLVRTPPEMILKARIKMQEQRAGDVSHDLVARMRARLDELMDGWVALRERMAEWKAQKGRKSRRLLKDLRREIREARRRVYQAYRGWSAGLRQAQQATI